MQTAAPGKRKFNRRRFLKLAASAGITAALSDALVTSAPWQNYEAQARRTWDTAFRTESAVPAQMRELVRYGTLAPSGHNTQPWKFAIRGNTIRVLPDYSRRLAVIDPQDRELWISLGCVLENLDIAARSAGHETEITLPTPEAESLTLHLRSSSVRSLAPLFEAIPHRQNTRSEYDRRTVPLADMRRIEAVALAPGISLHLLTAASQKEAVIEYVTSADHSQYGDQPFINELVHWLRFNKPEALHSLDGLYTRCSGNPQLPRWLGTRFITTASGGQRSEIDGRSVRSSSGLIVIAAAQNDKRHWIETGRLYQRLALTMTALNVKTAFLNQPVEVPALRSQFQSYLHLGTALPQLLLRFGYAAPMPRSLRRPVEQVLV